MLRTLLSSVMLVAAPHLQLVPLPPLLSLLYRLCPLLLSLSAVPLSLICRPFPVPPGRSLSLLSVQRHSKAIYRPIRPALSIHIPFTTLLLKLSPLNLKPHARLALLLPRVRALLLVLRLLIRKLHYRLLVLCKNMGQ